MYVASMSMTHRSPRFSDLQRLLEQVCHGIPLKLATVSDSGTVVMFGITNVGVPSIAADDGETGHVEPE
jgi:hypothetical protein